MGAPMPALAHARNAMSAALAGLIVVLCAVAAPAADDIVNYRGPDRQQKLLEGAAKEGQVVLYSALIVNQMLRPLTAAFTKKYPFIKMSYWRADSEELLPKISAESRAGNVVADLFEGSGGGEIAVAAGLTQPFYSPMLAEYPASYRDLGDNLAPTRLSYFSIAYNTKQVVADKVPKTYQDLLDPQWKGRMAWPYANTGRYLFLIGLRLAWGEDKAMDYFKKLAQQKVINFASGSARTLVDRVIAGEYPIAINIYAHHPLISAGKGAPVNSQLMDPVPSAAGTISVIKGAPHPHAAMLLVDFLLSKEGQKILSDAEYFPARPDVPPLPQLAGIVPKTAGYSEIFVAPQKLKEYIDSTDQILQNLFR
jgi:iron(III) transport system substrate-binding protein